ncbi:MAG: hypothetical protein WCP63_00505 [Cyanobium sp. ELA712]
MISGSGVIFPGSHRPDCQTAESHAPAPADVLKGDLSETLPELCLLVVDDFAAVALGTAVLDHHPTDEVFRSPATVLQDHDGPSHREGRLTAQQGPTASPGLRLEPPFS